MPAARETLAELGPWQPEEGWRGDKRPPLGSMVPSVHRSITGYLRIIAWLAVALAVGGKPTAAQIDGWSIGRTWSGMVTEYSDGMSSSSARDRRLVAVGISKQLKDWTPVQLSSGLRLTPKGFEVTGPTYQMEYFEIPLVASLNSGPGLGGFVHGGFLGGVRVHCRRRVGREWHGCGGEDSLSWWDLSWELGAGIQLRGDDRGAFRLFVRYARSIIDVKREAAGRSHNRVVTAGMAFTLR